jgi:hypothetical protein
LLLPLCFRLLQSPQSTPVTFPSLSPDLPHLHRNCPACGATMYVCERLSAAQLLLRSPPSQRDNA